VRLAELIARGAPAAHNGNGGPHAFAAGNGHPSLPAAFEHSNGVAVIDDPRGSRGTGHAELVTPNGTGILDPTQGLPGKVPVRSVETTDRQPTIRVESVPTDTTESATENLGAEESAAAGPAPSEAIDVAACDTEEAGTEEPGAAESDTATAQVAVDASHESATAAEGAPDVDSPCDDTGGLTASRPPEGPAPRARRRPRPRLRPPTDER
jgi:hypothetical protein